MPMIEWSNEYSVDIQEIDEQHKCLVKLINKLYDALAAKQHRDQVKVVLDELIEYTGVHFAVEETLMRVLHYPDYDNHKAAHDKITAKVKLFKRAFDEGEANVDMELLLFLKEWLTNHINDVDKKYVPHLTKNGVRRTWVRKFW